MLPLLKLQAGKHRVQFVANGYKDWVAGIEVKSGSNRQCHRESREVNLQRIRCAGAISATVSAAQSPATVQLRSRIAHHAPMVVSVHGRALVGERAILLAFLAF
jgi:hypothetical protein